MPDRFPSRRLKILQVNLGRGRTAHDILYATACA